MIIEKYLNLILEAHFNERKEMKAFFVTEAEMAKENHVKTTTFFNKCFDAVLKIEADLQNQLSRDKFENKKKHEQLFPFKRSKGKYTHLDFTCHFLLSV